MSIHTRYGSEVAIVGKTTSGVLAIDRKDGAHLWADLLDLKADGGLAEIQAAIDAAPVVKDGGRH